MWNTKKYKKLTLKLTIYFDFDILCIEQNFFIKNLTFYHDFYIVYSFL